MFFDRIVTDKTPTIISKTTGVLFTLISLLNSCSILVEFFSMLASQTNPNFPGKKSKCECRKFILCPNGRKKSHCMLVRRAACSQLCLGVKIARNVHTARFKGRKCSYRSLQRAKCSYRPKLDCLRLITHSHATRLFPPICTQNVVCTSSDMVAM